MDDPYSILGVSRNSSQEEITKKYKFLIKAYHPDRFPSDKDKKQAEEEMKKINSAYKILSHPESKFEYDLSKNNTSSTKVNESQNSTQNDIVEYLFSLLSKWESIHNSYIPTPYQEELSNRLLEVFTSYTTNIKPDDQINVLKQVQDTISLFMISNIAIGIQAESNVNAFSFPKIDLISITYIPFYQILVNKNGLSPQLRKLDIKTIFDNDISPILHKLGASFRISGGQLYQTEDRLKTKSNQYSQETPPSMNTNDQNGSYKGKIIGISIFFIVLCILAGIIYSSINQTSSNSIKSYNHLSTKTIVYIKSTATKYKTATYSCTPASLITLSDVGKSKCVYGLVTSSYDGYPYFFIRLGQNKDDFRFVMKGFYFNGLNGKCVKYTGVVENFNNDFPFITIGYNDDLWTMDCP